MKPFTSHREPSFRWQALLILLPVGLLTLAGFWALRQDRRLVEQDARERAAQALQTLADKVEQSLPFRLVDGASRGTSDDAEPPLPEGLLFLCRWSPDGRLISPPDYEDPPAPARWWGDLTPEQRAGWNELDLATAREGAADEGNAFAAWLEMNPPEAAQASARFATLQTDLREDDPASHEALLAFAREHPEATTPSGLPLMATVAATLLNHPEADTRRPLLLESLRSCVLESPSTLTPFLLRRAVDAWQETTNGPLEEVTSLSRLWQEREQLRQLAHALSRQAPESAEPTSLWLEGDDAEWLASFGPDRSGGAATSTNQAGAGERVAWFLPKAAAERVLGDALDSRGDGGLPYARLEVSVAGRRVMPASFPAPEETSVARASLLAEIEVAIDRLATDDEGLVTHRASDEFLQLPAVIPVSLSLRLVDPRLLYARQTQRAWLFGGLITTAAGAALLGLAGAYRAFRRQLRLAELKSNFVSSVSHELRAPIASVRLLAESLERGKIVEEPRRQEYFRLIGQECRRLSGLIENVLDFSRIDQGRKRYEFEPTNIAALVGETVRLMEPYAAERRVRLELTAPAESMELTADGRALQQALVNLLDNAIKHSPAGRLVRVGLEKRAGGVRLSVADAGPGIPAEDQERIFEPFFRRGSELRRETQGAGIGLSIVRHVVAAHQGRVSVRSSPGQGACFTVQIPFPSEGHEH